MLYNEIKSVKPRRRDDDDSDNDKDNNDRIWFAISWILFTIDWQKKRQTTSIMSQFFTIIFLQIAVFDDMRLAVWECDQSW